MSEDLMIVQNLIYEIRGQKVMLDFDLARLYQVETKALNQAVKRNAERFPSDFMFRLTAEEVLNMRSQIVTASKRNTSAPPFAFTEQGVAMLASVLKSPIAVTASISIMRAFVQVRQYLLTSASMSAELNELRAKVDLLALQREEDLGAVNAGGCQRSVGGRPAGYRQPVPGHRRAFFPHGGEEARTAAEDWFPAEYGRLTCHFYLCESII